MKLRQIFFEMKLRQIFFEQLASFVSVHKTQKQDNMVAFVCVLWLEITVALVCAVTRDHRRLGLLAD